MRRARRNKVDWVMLGLKLFSATLLIMALLFLVGASIWMWRAANGPFCPAP